jgi:hypothetical protein
MRLKLSILLVAVALVNGCMMYTDEKGHTVFANGLDQRAIHAELEQAQREYGNR